MTASSHRAVERHPSRVPFALGPMIAEARRFVGQHRVLITAAVVVLWGGGVAGGVVALNSSSGFQSAAACPGATSYVYAVPSYPAQAPPAPAWPPPQGNYWGWVVRRHPFKVGDRVRVDTGSFWQIKAIAALPNDCTLMHMIGPVTIGRSAPLDGGTVSGRLVLQPVR